MILVKLLGALGLVALPTVILLAALLSTRTVVRSVFWRNFASYFLTPTGYIFMGLFVFFCSVAAFIPPAFFNNNLANLDQLNFWFPLIMMVFIPTITMGIWSTEQAEGTDELLLTLPADDFDIVLGKYLSALGIYTAALLYSLLVNFIMLESLGSPDIGLFVTTYLGYWLIGVAMLAVGMTASFISPNITISFILGVLFCSPLVLISFSKWLLPANVAAMITPWSVGEKFDSFGSGLISLSAIAYFVCIAMIALYLSLVLIARRRWDSFRALWWRVLTFMVAVASTVCFACMIGLVINPQESSTTLLYLLLATVVLTAIFIAMELIAAWMSGDKRHMGMQYILRTLSLGLLAAGAIVFFSAPTHDSRLDGTSEKLNTLSSETVKIIDSLELDEEDEDGNYLIKNIEIEAFISPAGDLPQEYVQTRTNLINMLNEIQSMGKDRVTVRLYEPREHSEEAERAQQRFGIEPREVATELESGRTRKPIFMGIAFSCGLERVILPFIDRGIPVEYELVRSLSTVTQQKRRRIGIVRTDAEIFGGFNFQAMSRNPRWPIIDELRKQYEVVDVDPTQSIVEQYRIAGANQEGEGQALDALLVIQPSAMGPDELTNLTAAVQAGFPTAIFEDPLPFFARNVPATTLPRPTPGGFNPMMGRQQNPPKGDLQQLWNLLGIHFSGADGSFDDMGRPATSEWIVRQNFNPHTLMPFPQEFVFVHTDLDKDTDRGNVFLQKADDEDLWGSVTGQLQEVLLPFPGYIEKNKNSTLEFEPLMITGNKVTGECSLESLTIRTPFGQQFRQAPTFAKSTKKEYTLAARISGPVTSTAGPEGPSTTSNVNAVVISDIDMLHEAFFRLREQPELTLFDIRLDFDNVTLVLNALDALADDARFIELRKRRPKHRTLTAIEERIKDAKAKNNDKIAELQKNSRENQEEAEQAIQKEIDALRAQYTERQMDELEIRDRLGMILKQKQAELEQKQKKEIRERDEDIDKIKSEQTQQVRDIQNRFKMAAVLFPPIPLLILAAIIFLIRSFREYEGVTERRLKK